MKNIKIAKPYKPFARKILVVDKLGKGFPTPYQVLDDTAKAYVLNCVDQEVKPTPFEGKWVAPTLFRIATFPRIKKEDSYYVPDLKKKAKEQAKEALCRMEDERLIKLLDAAAKDYSNYKDHTISPNHVFHSHNPHGQDFDDAYSAIVQHELDVAKVLINPASITNELKAKAKEKKFKIIKSTTVPTNNTYLLAESSYLGVMPMMYNLDVEPMTRTDQMEMFNLGWVADELIGMLILNPRGIAIVKNSNHLD